MSQAGPNRFLRSLTVFAITVVLTTPLAVFLFVMGLVVTESVIYPTASLATAAIAGIVAGWAANSVLDDVSRSDLAAVVTRNLLLGILPAGVSTVLAASLDRSIWLIGAVLLFTSASATVLAFRHRTEEASPAGDGKLTVGWLVGALVGVGLVIFVSSLFGLTGA